MRSGILCRCYNRQVDYWCCKSLLRGIVSENNFIDVDGVTSGFRLTKEKKKPLYVSVGHKVNLIDAIEIVKQLVSN